MSAARVPANGLHLVFSSPSYVICTSLVFDLHKIGMDELIGQCYTVMNVKMEIAFECQVLKIERHYR